MPSLVPLKYMCSRFAEYGANEPSENYVDFGVRFLRTTDITEMGELTPLEEGVYLPERNVADYLLQTGDLLVSRSGTIGRSFLYDGQRHGRCAYAGYLVRFRPSVETHPRFLFYFTKTADFLHQIAESSIQTTIMNFNGQKFANMLVPALPLAQQDAIVSFLDRKTADIDALIGKKERLIERLQEKRQALITQAVTKGLDPSVPMKDSGVEWLGRIPASWTVLPLRRLLRGIEQGWSPESEDRLADEGEWAVLKLSAISKGRFRPDEQKALPSGTKPERRYEVHAGDLLLTRANTPLLVGDACCVGTTPPRLMLPDLIYRLSVRGELASPAYLARYLLSVAGRAQVMADARGSSMTMAKVSGSHIRSWLVTLPSSLEEQAMIVRVLEERCSAIDDLHRKLSVHIEKLREYRQALITAAVTGKIDVSKEAA